MSDAAKTSRRRAAVSERPSSTSEKPTTSDSVALDEAVRRASRALRAVQEDDGSWRSPPDMGSIPVAMTALVEAWFGALNPADSKRYVRSLKHTQRKDGGWDLHPYAKAASLGTTALCRAALRACGESDQSPVVRKAEARIHALGGYELVRERLLSHGEPAALFCVMAGLLPVDALPPISPDLAALPWSERMLDGRLHAGVPMVLYAFAAVRERFLPKKLLPSFLQAPARLVARARLTHYVGQFQNENGSWNGMVVSTVFALLALQGVGLGLSDEMVKKGFEWLETRKQRVEDRFHIVAFDGDIWETAFSMAALAVSDVRAKDEAMRAGKEFLLRTQCTKPQVRCNQPRRDAIRTGGFSFTPNNDTMPDTDDTAVALVALGLTRTKKLADDPPERAIAWLRGMQNASGGWGAYVHGLPDKKPGVPAFLEPPPRLDDLRNLPKLALEPPIELGDPATADLCGRILWGLGECGLTAEDPSVMRAVEFLRRDQCPNGSWWGVWNPAFVAGTAFALIGLAAVKADLRAPWVQRAAAWLVSVQTKDGGFGEDYESFQDPNLAGVGQSMPPLTGIALRALAEIIAAKAASPAVRSAAARASDYLIGSQQADGWWPDGGYLFTIVPPTLYSWGHHKIYYVLFGLGRYREVHRGRRRP